MVKDREVPQETEPTGQSTGEETEPLAEEEDEFLGVPGQIQYPDPEVQAEQAGDFVAGKTDSLYPDDEEGTRSGWQNPADRPEEERTVDEDDQAPEQTEPEAQR
jgi:hypothetical protein